MSPPDPSPQNLRESRLDTQLLLNNAVLEQSNRQDNTVWKIKADSIVYSEDKQTANLDRVVGNLLQDGKIILKISANKGEVKDNGNVIIFNENIMASDPRNDSAIESNFVEWRPQENLLLIKEDLNGIQDNLKVTAQKGKYFTDTEQLEVEGDVVATTEEPGLQLKSDRLLWNIPQNKVTSPGAVDIVRYDEKENVTDKLVSDRGEVDLTANVATLNDNIELVSLEPNIQAASQSFIWNYQQRVGQTDKPIQILDRDRQISLTGNQGEINLQQQIAVLKDGVRGINRREASELYARQLTWTMESEKVEAIGDVIYEQADPQARLTGEKASGTLGNNIIVVTSDGKKQVTSIIKN
ncbi:LPS export ABC transporter periplasmic protein LptC [Waterburya agarophytonicola K14]|uniref:LPS export ABC transporter periplasmic protein LptC n=2 Tax=Waterburya TaxID=2886915 RepID=A0A964BMR2_9CYAN|nr:LPS export ABC transporter periplasmic protein LptC [Waterburya agarophytonicola KI4]